MTNAQIMSDTMDEKALSAMNRKSDLAEQAVPRSLVSLLFVLLVVILCALGVWRLLDPATLPIRHVRIEGNFQHLSPEKMQTLVSDVIRGGFFNLNVMTIKEALLREPWVYWVVVQRVWPDGLSVHVKEQIPIAHWNEQALLNSSAQVFSPEQASSIEGLPFLTGPAETQSLLLDRYRRIQHAMRPFDIKIISLRLSERRAWQIQLDGGPLVILGRNDVDSRIDRFTRSLLASLSEELSRIKQIDMRYTNGFAIQWLGDSTKLIETGLEKNG